MENTITIKRNFLNLLLPTLFENMWRSILVFIAIMLISLGLKYLNILNLSYKVVALASVACWFVMAFILLIDDLFVLLFTQYRFHTTGIEKEFKFFVVRKEIVPYERVTNVILDISVWDRLCGAGDITIRTADDSEPDLVLKYVSHPEQIQKDIQARISYQKNKSIPPKR